VGDVDVVDIHVDVRGHSDVVVADVNTDKAATALEDVDISYVGIDVGLNQDLVMLDVYINGVALGKIGEGCSL